MPLHDLAGFTDRWVDAESIGLHAVEGGQPAGPAVVLLAGFLQTWWAWRKAMPGLAERFHVIALGLSEQGHSDRPHDSYDTHTVASRVQAAVTALDVRTYWLVAHDIGAWVAFSLALKYQERLHGLALLDAGIPGITLPGAIPILTAKALSPTTFDSAEIDHYAAAVAAEGGLRASLAYYRDAAESARENHDALERQQLTVPVLEISSSHGSIPDMAASLSPWADNATGAVIPHAGHFIPDEQPDAVVDALTAFIDHEHVA
ncbi:alpha/beta fold hydrolase [Amycolatopsis thermophila]|uniref:Pimeloyl-ACP methyl ester carboxylesterase n=1 Tax=Amycolatopsis thermophila TaxID=206084 RepID=A0ABU0F5W1_9PSEU|nr:alpha/beta fold hydrolase [Amycolatopsis thermophila]MDQ0382983.1 pimeloyl-ACP methyl ester carboxylesterase [Amycolatopsis thermophila]